MVMALNPGDAGNEAIRPKGRGSNSLFTFFLSLYHVTSLATQHFCFSLVFTAIFGSHLGSGFVHTFRWWLGIAASPLGPQHPDH